MAKIEHTLKTRYLPRKTGGNKVSAVAPRVGERLEGARNGLQPNLGFVFVAE